MAGRDILGSLLFGLGSGLSTYGKGKAEQIKLTEEEKVLQRRKEADEKRKAQAAQQENEVAAVRKIEMLRGVNPELADRLSSEMTRLKLSGLPIEPFDDGTIKMYQQKMESEKAQSILDQIGGQGALNQVSMGTGEEPREVIPFMQEQSFNQEGQGPQPVERMIRGAMDKIRAIQADKALNASKLKAKTDKEDAGSVFTQQESWDRYNRHLSAMQTNYEQAMRKYDAELARFNAAESKASTNPLYKNPHKEPTPPMIPTELSSYQSDPQTAFLAWAQRQSNMIGEIGGKVRGVEPSTPSDRTAGTPQEKPQQKDAQSTSVSVPDSIKSKPAYKKLKARGWSDERIMEELSK